MSTPLNSSILKGFEILALFSPSTHEISAGLVAERLGMNSATAHRFLATLEHAGAISRVRRGYFTLGPKLEELASTAEETNALSFQVSPVVEALCQDLGESVMACRFTRHGPICMAVAKADRVVSVDIGVGTLLPALSSAQGRLWLAGMNRAQRRTRIASLAIAEHRMTDAEVTHLEQELDDIRASGYAVNLGLHEPDIAAVSVPVKGRSGAMLFSLSVFGILSRFGPELIARAKDRMIAAAERLEHEL